MLSGTSSSPGWCQPPLSQSSAAIEPGGDLGADLVEMQVHAFGSGGGCDDCHARPRDGRSGEKRKGGLPYMPDILERISSRSNKTSIFYYF